MQCSYFDAGVCRSCTLLETPYARQIADKDAGVRETLAAHPDTVWLPPVTSPESGYRNKAKMVVGGTSDAPTLGILDRAGRGVDLRHCGISSPGIRAAVPAIVSCIASADLTPYDVPARRGELKYVLVTESPAGELMLRFVLRSEARVPALRRHLPELLRALPQARVVSVNLHPEHKATIEGPHEIVLTEEATLAMRVGTVDLHFRPQSFFQTNAVVAAELYAQARDWIDEINPSSLWDLYCGVGGFALSAAAPGRRVVGVEVSEEAVASARSSAADSGLTEVTFLAADATRFALESKERPELVIVNPPRRGIGVDLAAWLETSGVGHIVYSSCNPVTLAKDLAAMPSYSVVRARSMDMFPHTTHLEAITLLQRRS